MGFSHVELGTVTPRPQPGNPKPRHVQNPEAERAHQPDGVQQQGGRSSGRADFPQPLSWDTAGISIGKNFDTPLEMPRTTI